MRFLMRALSGIFRLLVQLRLWRYRSGWKPQHHLGTQVVAVGNITVGGTGKTPVVELLARSLRDRGRKVAILSRGYKSKKLDGPRNGATRWPPIPAERTHAQGGFHRSALLLDSGTPATSRSCWRNLDGVSVVVDKNRVKGGRFAIEHLDATRCCSTTACNISTSRMASTSCWSMPGALRHRGAAAARHPARAAEKPAPRELHPHHQVRRQLERGSDPRIRRYNKVAEIIECAHGPIHLENVFTGERQPLEFLKDKWVGAISAIAVPEAFEGSLKNSARAWKSAAASPIITVSPAAMWTASCSAASSATWNSSSPPRKDAVRFPKPKSIDVPVYFLRIEVEILKGGEIWDDLIHRLCHPACCGTGERSGSSG
jgi:tetraacyldisaccharide 4'-kinase